MKDFSPWVSSKVLTTIIFGINIVSLIGFQKWAIYKDLWQPMI